MNNKGIILGNGPSLSTIDLTSLSNYTTIGMNAAYRYWEKINWFPTCYICCDYALYKTHHKKINEFIENKTFQHVILMREFKQYNEDIENIENVHLIDSKKVKSKYTTVTTGSMAYYFLHDILNINTIYIAGIDCKYVDVLNESNLMTRETTDVTRKLQIADKVKVNPNYFFDDYQQVNDIYHIPNQDLHYQSWKVIKNLKSNIKNICPTSPLDLFDKCVLDDITYINVSEKTVSHGKKVISVLIIFNEKYNLNKIFTYFHHNFIPVDFRVYILNNQSTTSDEINMFKKDFNEYKKKYGNDLNIVMTCKYSSITEKELKTIKSYECATNNIVHLNENDNEETIDLKIKDLFKNEI